MGSYWKNLEQATVKALVVILNGIIASGITLTYSQAETDGRQRTRRPNKRYQDHEDQNIGTAAGEQVGSSLRALTRDIITFLQCERCLKRDGAVARSCSNCDSMYHHFCLIDMYQAAGLDEPNQCGLVQCQPKCPAISDSEPLHDSQPQGASMLDSEPELRGRKKRYPYASSSSYYIN